MKEDKIKIVEELKEKIQKTNVFYFVDFSGTTAKNFDEFRRRAKKEKLLVKVVNNRLALKAFAACGIIKENLNEIFQGPTLVIFGDEDPVTPARLLKELEESLPTLKFKGALFDNTLYSREHFSYIASLPTKEEARRDVVSVLASPLSGLIFTLESPINELVWILEQIKERSNAI